MIEGRLHQNIINFQEVSKQRATGRTKQGGTFPLSIMIKPTVNDSPPNAAKLALPVDEARLAPSPGYLLIYLIMIMNFFD